MSGYPFGGPFSGSFGGRGNTPYGYPSRMPNMSGGGMSFPGGRGRRYGGGTPRMPRRYPQESFPQDFLCHSHGDMSETENDFYDDFYNDSDSDDEGPGYPFIFSGRGLATLGSHRYGSTGGGRMGSVPFGRNFGGGH
ncbi:Nn.00g001470.m01.CDS01 [Neocucurbitaria sp. VM-36]